MVDGLQQRLGDDLNKINLSVNSVDWDKLDDRPLVVWFHHDINQAAVQWCRDKALVDRVAMSVFVSDWQRERYIRTYDFRSERCVVLRNATEVHMASGGGSKIQFSSATIAVIEAMTAGCRVITPYLGASPETTADYARLYPWQSDHNAHAAAFARVLKTEMEQPWDGDFELSEAGQRHCAAVYERARRDFEWRRFIGEVLTNRS